MAFDKNDIGKKLLERRKINDDLEFIMTMSLDEAYVFLDISYKAGKFRVQRSFRNDMDGRAKLNDTLLDFDSEDKVKKHFGMGVKK